MTSESNNKEARPAREESETSRPGNQAGTPHASEHAGGRPESFSVAEGISVPEDSNIIGGGAPGEGTEMGTASGPSDSGGG